jgi:adenosine deaminase
MCDAPAVVALAEALERLPKVELHCHVEGTMRPATLAPDASRFEA